MKLAARHEAARLLSKGLAATPSESGSHTHVAPSSGESAATAYLPGMDGPANAHHRDALDPREKTAVGRLEMALETLAPYERLACVSYFLDGVSTDAIASILGVPRERAVRILERAAPTIARAVGDREIPDFSVATDEIDVVTL